MVTGVSVETEDVVAVKPALVAPAATVTLAGTVATAVLLLMRDTRAPPVGAPVVSVTIPVDELPPVTDVGFTLTAFSAAGATVPKCGRTATESRKKSRAVELATLITRNRKFAFASCAAIQVRPQVSAAPPSVT